MRPSRNAHGQISTVSIDSARILASATRAPATICGARSALTPSNSARSAVVILEMKDMSCLRPFAVRVRFTRGPAADGAAPVSRASERKVFDVATARSGAPASSTSRAGVGQLGVQPVAQHRHPAPAGRVVGQPFAGQPPGAQRQRQRHLRLLVDAVGQLQRAAADVEVDDAPGAPPVPAAHRQEGQPRLVDAAAAPAARRRSPCAPGPARRRSSWRRAPPRWRRPSARRSRSCPRSWRTRRSWRSACRRRAGDLARAVDRLGQSQRGLGRTHRRRMPAAVGIDHQQMNRVAAHVEHAQSHGTQTSRAAWIGVSRTRRAQPAGVSRVGRRGSWSNVDSVADSHPETRSGGRAGLRPRVGGVLRPGQSRAPDRRRLHLAAVALDLCFRHAGLPGHGGGPPRRRVLLARRVPVRRRRPRPARRRGAASSPTTTGSSARRAWAARATWNSTSMTARTCTAPANTRTRASS